MTPISESRLGHVIDSVYLGQSKEVYVAALTMYVDDSGTSPSNEVAVAAGWIAPIQEWKKFENDWERAKAVQGDEFKCFHMTEFVAGKNEFEDWSYEKKKRVLARVRNIIKRRASIGFGMGVKKKDYDDLVPLDLRAARGKDHYTWVVRNLLGVIHRWRENNNLLMPIEYVFDWIEPHEIRRKEIEEAFLLAEDQPQSFERFGIRKGSCHFRDSCEILPLQASDIFAWTLYRGILEREEIRSANEIATETLQDFVRHRNGLFVAGGNSNRKNVKDWVTGAIKEKGKTW